MQIVQATMQDMEKIAENNIAMAKESENVTLSKTIALAAVENLIKDKAKGFYLLVKQEDGIIGQLMITFEWSDWRNATIWWIQSVFVKPSHRKQGVFQLLYNHVKKLAKKQGILVIRLYVHNQNENAIKVYESLGMKKKDYLIFQASSE